jgi:hypothetical protein
MRKLKYVIIVLLLSCISLQAQNSCNTTLCLFQKVENKMQIHYKTNRLFEDPLGRIGFLFKTVSQEFPDLLSNAVPYKDELLKMLIDNSVILKKNSYTNDDIIFLLYNMNIDNYVDFLIQICDMYKHGLIDFQIFNGFIFQHLDVSDLIAKNYENEKLIHFFDTILKDGELMDLCYSHNKEFKNSIIQLKTGEYWNDRGKLISKIQPPIIETLPFRIFKDIPKTKLDQVYRMKLDTLPLLNKYESAYLNEIFKEKGFDFTGKKIGFLTKRKEEVDVSNKKRYFEEEKRLLLHDYSTIGGILYIFDEKQKEESGGYDAAIYYYWSLVQMLPEKDVVERLKEQ